jgi:hypothetical protein
MFFASKLVAKCGGESLVNGRYQAQPQAERAGSGWARGLRMEAHRAKTRRSRGLVHESRPPEGASPNVRRNDPDTGH